MIKESLLHGTINAMDPLSHDFITLKKTEKSKDLCNKMLCYYSITEKGQLRHDASNQ